tara:strand:- start:1600 stop:2127 length:528 start_codon:yes stop_codon:yes gene_type:complete
MPTKFLNHPLFMNHAQDEAEDERADYGEDGVHGETFFTVLRVEMNIPAPIIRATIEAGTRRVSFNAKNIGGTRDIPTPIKSVRFPIAPGISTIDTIPAKIASAPAKLRGQSVAAISEPGVVSCGTEIDFVPLLGKGIEVPPVVVQAEIRPAIRKANSLIGRGDPAPMRRVCSRGG